MGVGIGGSVDVGCVLSWTLSIDVDVGCVLSWTPSNGVDVGVQLSGRLLAKPCSVDLVSGI